MKRFLTAALTVCCVSCGAQNCTQGRSTYEGAYIGAGLSYQNNMQDVRVGDNVGDTVVKVLLEIYADSGNPMSPDEAESVVKNQGIFNFNNHRLNKKNKEKIGGTISLGYGRFVFSNLYLGADFSLDISEKSKSVESDNFLRDDTKYGDTTVQNNAVVPTLALKVGGYIPDIDTLACVRAGAAKIGIKVQNELLKNEKELCKITPVVGISIEKKVWKNCSLKLEGDYRFPVSKRIDGISNNFVHENGEITYPGIFNEKIKTRSYNVRFMCVYHF